MTERMVAQSGTVRKGWIEPNLTKLIKCINKSQMKTILLSLIAVTLASPAHAATTVFYASSPTSYVGRGLTETLTPSAPAYTVNVTFWNDSQAGFGFGLYDLVYVDIMSNPGYPSSFYSMAFGTEPGDSSMGLGRYENAARFGTMVTDQPHLDFAANGRGYNDTAGWFEIVDFQIDQFGDVERFAADFYMTGSGGAADWIVGSVRHNSSVPVNTSVPEPGRAALILIGAAGLMARRRRALA